MSRTTTTTSKACGGRCARCTTRDSFSAATRFSRTVRAAAQRCRAMKSRRGTRTLKIRACTSRWISSTRRATPPRAGVAASSCGPRRRGHSCRTRRLPCTRSCTTASCARRAASTGRSCSPSHACRPCLVRIGRTAGTSYRRTVARSSRDCAIAVRSTGCRFPTKATTRSSSRKILCLPMTAAVSCTCRRRSAPTTTRRVSGTDSPLCSR